MKTIIEMFDERPLENIIGPEVFRPEKTVYICSTDTAGNRHLQTKLREYLKKRGIHTELDFCPADLLSTESVAKALETTITSNDDCVLDITGGSESALFAAGIVCAGNNVPVVTYSRRCGRFFNVRGEAYSAGTADPVKLSVEDCFLMAGGSLREGRVDNNVLSAYAKMMVPFFDTFLRYRKEWVPSVVWFQRASRPREGMQIQTKVRCSRTQKTERGGTHTINPELLQRLEKIGMLRDLDLTDPERVSFSFYDLQTRTWLRDMGSVLELYVYRCAMDTGLFDDVISSAVVDWEGNYKDGDVTNEIDVMATRGVVPFFISCKICDVKTEALNELAILRDRFGGKMAKAAIVTAEYGGTAMRHRAQELGIDVIDLGDLKARKLRERLAALTREEK